MPSIKSDQLDASIRSGKLSSLYLFDGPENWLKEKAVQQMIDKLLPPEARDFNLDRFDGNTNTAGQVVSSLNSLPFLAERRVVVIKSAEEFSAADGRAIGEVLQQVPKTTCALFIYQGKANIKEEIPAQILSYGVVVTFWTPFANQLPAWVTAEVKKRGKTISYEAAGLLAEACSDLQDISNELDKLILFTGKKAVITADDVEAHGLPDDTGTYKELEAALWTRNLTEGIRQAELLNEMGVRPESLFYVFERVFRTLILGNFYLQEKKWPLEDIYSALFLRGKTQQSQFSVGLKAYSQEELRNSLGHIIQADNELKTGTLPGNIALTLLILNLLKRKTPERSLVFR